MAQIDIQWDPEVLAALDVDLNQFWDESELRELLKGIEGQEEIDVPDLKVDQAAELQKKWGTKPGQIWEIRKHRSSRASSEWRILQELARANVFGEFSRPRSIVAQFFDPILRTATAKCAAHFSSVIESTCIALVLASRVPITLTFFPMNFSGVFWSLSA